MIEIDTQFFGGRGSGGSGGARGGRTGDSKVLPLEKEFPQLNNIELHDAYRFDKPTGDKVGYSEEGMRYKEAYANTTGIKRADTKGLVATIPNKSGNIVVDASTGEAISRHFSKHVFKDGTKHVEVSTDYKVKGSDGRVYIVRTRQTQDLKEYIVNLSWKKRRGNPW